MATVTIRVQTTVPWKVGHGSGGNWIAVCDPLALTVQSETWASLMEDIGATLDAVMRNLLETDDLNRFLKEHGWKLARAIPARRDNVRFDVPFIPALVDPHGSKKFLHQ